LTLIVCEHVCHTVMVNAPRLVKAGNDIDVIAAPKLFNVNRPLIVVNTVIPDTDVRLAPSISRPPPMVVIAEKHDDNDVNPEVDAIVNVP
jgi:hypothetical protein